MQTTALRRAFHYNGQTLPDPGASLSPAQVKDLFTSNFPDLINAEIEGPNEKDGVLLYTFKRSTGTKGSTAMEAMPSFLQRLALVAQGQPDPLAQTPVVVADRALLDRHQRFKRQLDQSRKAISDGPTLPSSVLPLLP